ncbi:MAG: hypothetical protein AMJ92_07705 [candidate division Zixibacteria bacterium SM23_81]|nr:MAG: hypothetical protein AMJ92_07705 [candidate division Zixibacteria bacterium SM23_81]
MLLDLRARRGQMKSGPSQATHIVLRIGPKIERLAVKMVATGSFRFLATLLRRCHVTHGLGLAFNIVRQLAESFSLRSGGMSIIFFLQMKVHSL